MNTNTKLFFRRCPSISQSRHLFLLFVFVSFCSLLNAFTWHIKQDGTGNFTTIQEGINASADSDTVLVYPGTYYENLDFNGMNIVLASLELTTGNEQYIFTTIINGQRIESCIRIHNGETDAHIQGFTIQNGYGTQFWSRNGGGVLVHDYSTVYIANCIIKNNIAASGAGLYARHGFLNISGVTIKENSAHLGGACYLNDDSTLIFDPENRCSIYNNNAGRGADIYIQDTGHVNVIVDTFTIFGPSRFFAEFVDGSTLSFDIQNNWMELEPHDLYVAADGDDTNSGLTSTDPLRNISWAVRKIQADEQNPRTVHVAAGTYSWAANQQIYPFGCKEYVSVIGENMDNTILYNDYLLAAINGKNVVGTIEFSNFSIQNNPDNYTAAIMSLYDIDKVILSNIKIQNNSNINRIFTNEYVYNEYDNLIITDNITDGTHSGLSLAKNVGYLKSSIIKNNINISPDPHGCVVAMDLMAYDDFTIENCVFSENQTTTLDSRIIRITNHNGGDPNIKFINCLISDNSVGSGNVFQVFNYDGTSEFNNCTFTNNTTNNTPNNATIYAYGDITLKNTIIHNNTDYEIYMVDDTQYGYIYELNLDHCNIKNGEEGVYNMNNANIINWLDGNIEDDPLFLLSGDYPYQLTLDSPCVDTGTPDTLGLFLPPWDLLHNYRVWDGDNNGTAIIDMGCYEFGADEYPVGITNDQLPVTDYQLTNFPNPFNPETKIVFDLPESGQVKLEIYNIKGQKVKTLLDCYMSPGRSEMLWNSKDDNGKRVSSGVYFYRLQTPMKKITKKMLMLK
ncbi:MAG: T9SS type A sorting domain-containing protein [Candidatus Cloacimonadota bacterium]|nr:T9SS type A sorting domain-containing protein [Candidatus Cloacimonadota bacterium]